MPTYREILESEIDSFSPVTTQLLQAYRDNVLAITTRANGAPTIHFPRIDSLGSTPGSATWVVPEGVTQIRVNTISGGQGGAFAASSTSIGNRGGSNIWISFILSTTEGQRFNYTIGAGGAGAPADFTPPQNSSDGSLGGTTTFGSGNPFRNNAALSMQSYNGNVFFSTSTIVSPNIPITAGNGGNGGNFRFGSGLDGESGAIFIEY